MKTKVLLTLLICLALFAVVACAPEPPPPPPEPEEPPEPTPQEYRQQLLSLMGDMIRPGVAAQNDDLIPGVYTQLQTQRMQLMATDNGRGGLSLITKDVEEAIQQARTEERWRKISILAGAYKVLSPDSIRFDKLKEYADLMLKRPRVTLTGFMDLDGELYAFLDLFDPVDSTTHTYRCREGEEFHGNMRLARIIGNQHSAEIEYLPLSYSWIIVGPRERGRVGPRQSVN